MTNALNLPPKPTHETFENPNGREIGRDLQTGRPIMECLSLTVESANLFRSIVADLGNWNGSTPTFNHGGKAMRGNLTQLKLAGLVRTEDFGGDSFVFLTPLGYSIAKRANLPGFYEGCGPTE